MKHLLEERRAHVVTLNGAPPSPVYVREPAFQAFTILRVAFAALPIIVGADKLSQSLAVWSLRLAPTLALVLGRHVRAFMNLVCLVEISAGVLVAVRPRWGAPVVGVGLLLLAANLLMAHGYFEMAVRDLALAAGALALYRLSAQFDD
jgi:hypothetical protein